MIIDNELTATNTEPPLFWEPSTVFQAALLTAVLVTVLSFQATSIFYDLLLGAKPKHQASAPYMHSLLLTDESSPLSIAAAILRVDLLDQLRFHLPTSTTFKRVKQSIAPATVTRLFLLLAAAPIINIITIVLALETDRSTTFADANIKVSLAFTENAVKPHPYVALACDRLQDSFKGDITAQFYLCKDFAANRPLSTPSDVSKIRVTAGVQGDIRIEILIKSLKNSAILNRHAEVSISPNTFRLAHAVNQDNVDEFAKEAAEVVDRQCVDLDPTITESSQRPLLLPPPPSRLSQTPLSSLAYNSSSQRQIVSQLTVPEIVSEVTLRCTVAESAGLVPSELFSAADHQLTQRVSVVDVDDFLVAKVSDLNRDVSIPPTWIRGNDLPVIQTRSQIAPVLWIVIAVAIFTLIRLLVTVVTHNDVADAVEAVVASGLGFQDGYELVRCDELVTYDHKLQHGELFQYGTRRAGWHEVSEFSRDVGVLWHEDERYYRREFNGKLYDGNDADDDDLSSV